ncbi:Peroxisomal membrane protein pex16 [Rhizoclosmatium hyalinum]|nr:Peroxisomal membrane protein pex16 [Rhizoclosmatium hyalinum]
MVLEAYKKFLLTHAPIVGSLENLAESVTYVLPGRFAHSELVAEGLHSVVSLLAAYHDAVLSPVFGGKTPNKFNAYTRRLLALGSAPRLAAYIATLLNAVQVFAEMLAKDYVSESFRWKVIAKLELLKFVCRLVLFRASKGRMLLGSHVPERDYDMASIQEDRQAKLKAVVNGEDLSVGDGSSSNIGKHSGKLIPSILSDIVPKAPQSGVSEQDVASFLNRKAASVSEALLPIDLVSQLETPGVVAEWMHMLRPLVYLMALRKYGTKSWNPWVLSLILEASSLGIHYNAQSISEFISGQPSTTKKPMRKFLEKDELQRRLWLLGYYLLRDPCYSLFVKERLDKFCESMSKKPIISLASGLLADYIPLWENYYFLVNP